MTASSTTKTILMAKADPKESFPSTLHRMLTEIEELAGREPSMAHLKQIISWQGHGLAFKIHDRQKFINIVMPIWFCRLKYSSFVRQMNLFGFKRIQQEGSDKGAMFHESFIRDEPEMAAAIEKLKKNKKHNEMASELQFQRLLLNRCQSAPAVSKSSWDEKPVPGPFSASLPSSPQHAPATTSLHSMMMPSFPSDTSLRDMLLPIVPTNTNESSLPNLRETANDDSFDPFEHLWRTLDDDNEPLPLSACDSWDMEPFPMFSS